MKIFEGISWTTYFEVVLFSLAAYYTVVILLFFKSEVMLIVSGKSTSLDRNNKTTSDATAEAFIDDDQQEQIKNLFDDITTVIKQAGLKGYPKEELLFALGNLLSKDEFIILRKPSLRKATDVYIKDECENYCSMQLSDDEMRRLWIGR